MEMENEEMWKCGNEEILRSTTVLNMSKHQLDFSGGPSV